jgi:hypothetical protein
METNKIQDFAAMYAECNPLLLFGKNACEHCTDIKPDARIHVHTHAHTHPHTCAPSMSVVFRVGDVFLWTSAGAHTLGL